MAKTRDTTVALTQSNAEDRPRRALATLAFSMGDDSEVVSLYEGQALVVGRSEPADVAIGHPSLSRQHARFELTDTRLSVEDLVSTNGTKINGKRITKRTYLKEGDELRMGAVHVVFQLVSPLHQQIAELLSYERFTERLHEEVVRAKRYCRQLALLMVRSPERPAQKWATQVVALLGELDRATLYGPHSLCICMPEAGAEAALKLGHALVAEEKLLCTIAVFPDQGTHPDTLLERVREAHNTIRADTPVKLGIPGDQDATSAGAPIVISPEMRALYETAERVARADLPVLVTGETGAGKELLVQSLHHNSGRKGPLRSINCGAIAESLLESALFGHEKGAFTGAAARSKGIFEAAHGGTVMLDEVGELSAAAQASLLRILETGKLMRVGSSKEISIDARVVAATHQDLAHMVSEGAFRQDLFYRLNTVVLEVPPLRERPEEVMPLAKSFLAAARTRYPAGAQRISPEAAALLQRHHWPGNVRELRNVIERAAVIAQGDGIMPDDLPNSIGTPAPASATPPVPSIDASRPLKDQVEDYEIALLRQALETHQWNQTRTARALGMPLRTLVHKIKKFGIVR